MANCKSYSDNGVPQLIDSQLGRVTNAGTIAFNLALDAMRSIDTTFQGKIAARQLNLNPPLPTADELIELSDFEMPEKPEADALKFTLPPTPPTPPTINAIDIKPGTAPTYSGVDPILVLPVRPSAMVATRPTDPADIKIPTYPVAPDTNIPPAPNIRSYLLPEVPDIDVDAIVAEFKALYAQRPKRPNVDLHDSFLTSLDQQYAVVGTRAREFIAQCPALANLCPRLGELLSGGSIGIPVNVEQAMRDRGFSALDQAALREEKKVLGDWASRGFTLPGGTLETKLAAVRDQAREDRVKLARDIYIETAKLEIENLRFAIERGIALEGQYQDFFLKLYGACQSIAAALFDVQYRAVTLKLEVYKVELAAWRDYAEFFKSWLQAELSKLEAYKLELEGKKLLGELNVQDIELYKAQLASLDTAVTIFAKEIDAANGRLQGELSVLEAFKIRMQGYAIDAGVTETEWKAYASAIQGETSKAEFAKAAAQAFAARVDAYKAGEDTKRAQGSFELEEQKLKLSRWTQQSEYFKDLLQGEIARVESETRMFGAKTGLFSAEIQGQTARSGVESTEAGLRLQKYGIDTNLEVEQARLALQEVLESSKIAVQALGDISRTASQLAAGAYSALNMSASMGANTSWSEQSSCEVRYTIDES